MNSLKHLIEYKNNSIYMTPSSKTYKKVLFFMHGLGDSANSFVPFFQAFPLPDFKIVLLNAEKIPVTINGGAVMPSWYDILDLTKRDESSISKKDVIESSKKILKFVEEEAKDLNNDYSKIFLGGFSQGACMSLYTGLSHDKSFGGLISLSGLLFPFVQHQKERLNTPIFLANGKYDSVIPYDLAQYSFEPLLKNNELKYTNVEPHSYNIEHTIDNDEIKHMIEFLQKL